MSDTTTTEIKSPEREAMELEKMEVEIAGLKIDQALKVLDQDIKAAELREKLAKALEAEHDATYRGIVVAEKSRSEELLKIQDHFVFHHLFDEPVDRKSVFACLNTMNMWHRQYPESDWHIEMNSPGGSVIAGMHLFDQITAYSKRGGGNHKITMTVRGYAASMAGILLQAADVRRIGPEAFLMIHEISAGTGGKIGEIKDDVKWYEKLCERVVDIFVNRSQEAAKDNPAIKGITKAAFKKSWERIDWWVDSAESLRLGFVDEIA